MLQFGSLSIKNPYFLAPMAGFTDTCTRRLAKKTGAGLVYTEMISAAGLVRRQKKTFSLLAFHPDEKPLGVQIFGAEPQVMADAAQIVYNQGAAFVDVNLGCPAKKVCRTGAGAALLQSPYKVGILLEKVRKAISCPLTIKMRLGWDSNSIYASQIAKIAEECGIDAIALHPRTRSQLFQGTADWNWIIRLKAERTIPIIGSGDILNAKDAYKKITNGDCDALMIGRAARGNPWIFSQIKDLHTGKPPTPISSQTQYNDILQYLEWQFAQYGKAEGLRKVRFLLLHYIKGRAKAAHFRSRLLSIESPEALQELLRDYFLGTAHPA